jgi:Holliday junction resolvase RusA-like endonuclease
MAETIAGHGYGRKWRAFVPIEPPTVTHNDLVAYVKKTKGGKMMPGIRKSDRLKEYESALTAHLSNMALTTETLDGPLRETVKLCYPPTDSHRAGEPKTTKPDMDNVVKTINDVLENVGVIANDSRICDLRVIKAYSEPAGIFIRIEELEDVDG